MKTYDCPGGKDYSRHPFKDITSQVLRFEASGFSDCYIKFEGRGFRSLEVLLGGWGNEFSAITLNDAEELAKARTEGIMHINMREFWITWQGTEMCVGKGGDCNPILKATVPLPFNIEIKKYGFTTGSSSGHFKFLDERQFVTNGIHKIRYEPLYGEVFTFTVSCAKDAHLVLATKLGEPNRKYEIILGGEDNSNSTIKLNDNVVATQSTLNECTEDAPKHYSVDLRFGSISVRRVADSFAFMRYKNPKPITVKHVGFGTPSVMGKWSLHF